MKKTVIVTGGRDYRDHVMVNDLLDFINPDIVIQGGAFGADQLAREWAEHNKKSSITVKADWDKHGKSAGPRRNIEMLELYKEAVVLSFPGGIGTAHCTKAAADRNMIVLQVHK